MLSGKGSTGRTGLPGLVLQCGGHTETLLKEELRRDSKLGRDLVLTCVCAHVQRFCHQRTQSDRVMLKGLWEPTQELASRGQCRVEILGLSLLKEQQAGDWMARN